MKTTKLTNMDFEKNNEYINIIQRKFSDQGYTLTNTSLIEDSDIFTRKSGVKLSSKLYSFIDPSGRSVSLRPEFTTSIIKNFLKKYETSDLPLKFQYCGPVFAYNPNELDGLEQRTQIGVELLGENSLNIDADIISMSVKALEIIGIDKIEINIGNLELFNKILSVFELSTPAKSLILNNIHQIQNNKITTEEIISKAKRLGILNTEKKEYKNITFKETKKYDSSGAILKENLNSSVGQRSADDIIERLFKKRKFSDNIQTFKDAISLTKSLIEINGPPEKTLDKIRSILSNYSIPEKLLLPLEEISNLLGKSINPINKIHLVPAHIRGLEYYTGIIFDINYKNKSESIHLGGGGRYDDLVQIFGGKKKVPALGFAYSLENILKSLEIINVK